MNETLYAIDETVKSATSSSNDQQPGPEEQDIPKETPVGYTVGVASATLRYLASKMFHRNDVARENAERVPEVVADIERGLSAWADMFSIQPSYETGERVDHPALVTECQPGTPSPFEVSAAFGEELREKLDRLQGREDTKADIAALEARFTVLSAKHAVAKEIKTWWDERLTVFSYGGVYDPALRELRSGIPAEALVDGSGERATPFTEQEAPSRRVQNEVTKA